MQGSMFPIHCCNKVWMNKVARGDVERMQSTVFVVVVVVVVVFLLLFLFLF